MSQPGFLPDSPRPVAAHMIRPAARHAILLLMLAVAACYDRPNAALSSDKAVRTKVPDSSQHVATGGVTAVTAEAATKKGHETDPNAKEEPALPNRNHRDSVALASMTKPDSVLDRKWPVKMPEPLPGAIFPKNRVVAYYGNPLSKKMGVLGEYPKDEMLRMLDREVVRWAKADPAHPVVPALHLIVTVAQGAPGRAGLYRLQMRDSMVNDVYSWIKSRNGLFFIDVQVGKSSVQAELPRLRPFLENPDVHLAIDPEFAMATRGVPPGKKIGTLDAADINWAVQWLDEIVRSKNLPPKILVVHRFRADMVPDAESIKPTANVQVVMDMDGWGPPWLKFDSYRDYIVDHPVEYTGFKLFYHNDTKKGDPLLTPEDVLKLRPRPLYIQYQ